MKTGRSLTELAAEIERRASSKADYVANTSNIAMGHTDGHTRMWLGDRDFGINSVAHGQIAAHTEIPKAYYDRMLEHAPGLLTNNVNEWFRKYPAPRMIRTLDNSARAFLSDKFSREMDNDDLAEAVLPVLLDMNLDIVSSEITDRRLYIKAVDKRVNRELAKTGARLGDGGHTIVRVVSPAVTISNSEVGYGSLSIQGGVNDHWCSNLASFGERSMRKAHLGQKQSIAEGELYAMLSDQSKRLNAAALWSTVKDVVRGVFDQAKFDALVDRIEGTQQAKIAADADVVKVVELSSKKFGLNDTEGKGVLRHLIEAGDLSQFGLHNAITRMSQDIESYDRATELERIGGQVIELGKANWRLLAEAA